MKERIIKIMEAENLTPSLFADKLNIGRAVISHILNGRNNPSLDVVIRILDTIDYIDADWLLSGKGNMRKLDNMPQEEIKPSTEPVKHIPTDLFDDRISDTAISPSIRPTIENPAKEVMSSPTSTSASTKEPANNINPIPAMSGATNKKVSKVIIYYSDNTFQAFNPDNTPL